MTKATIPFGNKCSFKDHADIVAEQFDLFLDEENEEVYDYDSDPYGCKNLLYNLSFLQFYEKITNFVIGQDVPLKRLSFDIYQYIKDISQPNKPLPRHIPSLIAGPSGCGKTEFYRAVQRTLKMYGCMIPVIKVDVTAFTQSGFQGAEVSEIAEYITKQNPKSSEAIVFLDEIDKTMIPQSSPIVSDAQKMLTYDLLNMIDGSEYYTKKGMRPIDTSKVLFIGMGAFEEIRKEKDKCNPVGFVPQNAPIKRNSDITKTMLLQKGVSPQFLGRFGTIINFHEIDPKSFIKLIDKILHDLSKQYDVSIQASEKTKLSYKPLLHSPYGVRGLRNAINDQIVDCLMNITGETESTIILQNLKNIENTHKRR